MELAWLMSFLARVKFDGDDPDADTGHPLANGAAGTWSRAAAAAAKFIRDDATDAVIYVSAMTY